MFMSRSRIGDCRAYCWRSTGRLLRVAQILVQRLQLRELALLRRAGEHVIANELELVAQVRQQRLHRRDLARLLREQRVAIGAIVFGVRVLVLFERLAKGRLAHQILAQGIRAEVAAGGTQILGVLAQDALWYSAASRTAPAPAGAAPAR
jgi:hypothetical protein